MKLKGEWVELLYHARNYTDTKGFQGARVTVELRDSDRTRTFYPFASRLDATFALSGGLLTVDYTITSESSNSEPMIFAIGNHIAFKVPFLPETDPAAMTFESPNRKQLLRNSLGFVNGEETVRSFEVPERLGDFDAHVALALTGYQSAPYAVLTDPQGLSIRVSQQATSSLGEPIVRFNIYGGPKVGYFSPEPWFGLQNSLNLGKPLVHLVAGDTWTWRVQVKATVPPPESPKSSGVERFGGNFGYIEGPVWSREGFLVFSARFDSKILKMASANQPEIYRDNTNGANGNAMDVQGRLYSCERDGRRVVRMEKDGRVTVMAAEYQGKRLNDPNDVVVRRDGQVYFSDPAPKDSLQHFELGYAGVYHVNPGGQISLIAKMPRPNGVTLTPDGRTLYVADTFERTIMAYDLDAAGNATNERVFISNIDGGPDGLRVAANGNVYIACRGIAVYTPQGQFIKMIEFPEMPANLTFGDSDLQTIYVTARTSVYRVRIPDRGYLLYGDKDGR